ncbi:MAG TPA: DEAD/DEAH box helicase, partial [Candidatus Altiarchaeales archaeon]|nr:DEAD/DEAH box helicase [Candidatus Altiarchaeales archaeon]
MYINHPLVKPESISLRRYQESVVSRAIDANTLVILPTGLGKTIIAAMVSAHRLYKFPDSKVLFLAPTRPLAVQHQRTFNRVLNIENMTILTGMTPVKERNKLWKENRLVFATPQTIENDIMRGLSLSDVSLLIFDECHRAVGNYSYVSIAGEYMKTARNPLILGLTASPSSDDETVNEICNNLYIDRIEAKTDHDTDVKPYIQSVRLEWVKVDLPQEFLSVKKMIEEILREDLRELKSIGYLDTADLTKINKRKLLTVQSDIRKEIVAGMDSYVPASLIASALKINHALELLETQGISSLNSYLERLQKQRSKAIKKLFSDTRMKNLVKAVHDLNVLGIDHPKLDKLVQIVDKHRDEKVIIFTQYRDSVEKIIDKLNENDLTAHEFIGQSSRGDKKGMTQKEQIRVLENFRDGKYNALVATSVAEEGIDIP